jgi:hypothetical protein
MTTNSGRDLPEPDERDRPDGNERSDAVGPPAARPWTRDEMEKARPYPLPELPEDEGPHDRR